jgi:hypothetical protein
MLGFALVILFTAAVAMQAYFFTGHRGLARRMVTAWAEDD